MNSDIEEQLQFYQLIDAKPTEGKDFEFQTHQLFAEYFINPYTANKRVHNMSGTGLGKTMSALLVAKKFIDAGRPVFIIGFQEERFIDELLHQPSLGFVTDQEVNKLRQLEQALLSNNQEIKNAYSNYRSILKSRLKAIKFFGYKLLTLRVYNGNYNPKDENSNVYINFEFIRSFHGSFIICDEIQNAYNSIEINNWGRSLQLIFNIMGPNIHVLTISSTPFLISSETRNFLNTMILTPGINIGGIQYSKSRKEQLKIANEIIDFQYDSIKHLRLPDIITEDDIARVLKGKILFMPDAGSEYIPKKIFHGIEIQGIPYLKFYLIPMSRPQELATKNNVRNHQYRYLAGMLNDEKGITSDIVNDKYKISLVYDETDENNEDNSHEKSEIHELANVEYDEFKKINGIIIKQTSDGIYYSGEFLKLDKLNKYSTKYAELFKIMKNAKRGKILLYHYDVHGVGVLTLEEICRYNGIIDINTDPNEYTRCAICFDFMNKHDDNNKCPLDNINSNEDEDCEYKFTPMRFMSIHSKTGSNVIRNILARYNLSSNKYGDDVRLLIGSRKIREGIDFKCVRTQITLSLPVNISMFIQLLGRSARQKSHILLKPNEQYVDEYIMVCGYEKYMEFDDKLGLWKYKPGITDVEDIDLNKVTPEIIDYKNKMQDYLKVQQYMKVINQIAADVYIYNTNKLIEENIRLLNPDVDNVEQFRGLGTLPYKPVFKALPTIENVNNTVYNALKYNREEVLTINFFIKQALSKSNVWEIEELWQFIHNSSATPNPKTFNKGNYIICLQYYPKLTIVGDYIIHSDDVDIDCFNREDNVKMFGRMIKINKIKDDEIIAQIYNNVKHNKTPDGRLFLRNTYLLYEKYDLNTHLRLLINAILNSDKQLLLFYSSLFELYTVNDLRITTMSETPDRIIGFKLGWFVFHMINANTDKFKQLTMQKKINDNDIIIGMYTEEMDFKLRENIEGNTDSMNKIKRLKVNKIDLRKLSKGIMCNSVHKDKLLTIANKLGIKDIDKKKNLCEQIKEELIIREEKKHSGFKWFYLQTFESITEISEINNILMKN